MRYSSYKTGILEIDIQHVNIDFLLSELTKEELENKAKEKIYEVLKDTLALHFDFEEEWAKTNNKEFDPEHQKSHKELLEKLNEMKIQYTNKELNMYEISLTFKMALVKHVQDHDIKLNA
jgi:hemerythrin-like metal-binding protein